MTASAPLQVLLFCRENDPDTSPYEEAIVHALQGGKEAGGYLATGEDLGIQLEIFSTAPETNLRAKLDSFSHTLTLVLVGHELLARGTNELWDWLADCWTHTSSSNDRHAMLVVSTDEAAGEQFSAKRPQLGRIQLLQVTSLGERAIRPSIVALRVLHECRLLLVRAMAGLPYGPKENLRLFISHAKMDGLPLAHALRHQIQSFGWLQKFYDADDLPPGCDWQKELEQGVGSSLVIMLRTDAYDNRYWCQQEVLWADEYATPAVLVDARTRLNYAAGVLPFERVPSLRIPDGNLFRILFLALREGVRFACFMRRVEQMKTEGVIPSPVNLRVSCFAPSMSALLRACHSLQNVSGTLKKAPFWILYPDPALRSGLCEAAHALIAYYLPDARLLTPNTIAATKGIT